MDLMSGIGDIGTSEIGAGVNTNLLPWLGGNIFTKARENPSYNINDIRNRISQENQQFFADPRMQNFAPFIAQGKDALNAYVGELSKNPIEEINNYTQSYKDSPIYSLLSSKIGAQDPRMGNFAGATLMQNAQNNANQLVGFRNENLSNLGGIYDFGSRAAQDYLNSAMAKANALGQQYINEGNQAAQGKMNEYNAAQGFGGLAGMLGGMALMG